MAFHSSEINKILQLHKKLTTGFNFNFSQNICDLFMDPPISSTSIQKRKADSKFSLYGSDSDDGEDATDAKKLNLSNNQHFHENEKKKKEDLALRTDATADNKGLLYKSLTFVQ
jgi:hypothetical protein